MLLNKALANNSTSNENNSISILKIKILVIIIILKEEYLIQVFKDSLNVDLYLLKIIYLIF